MKIAPKMLAAAAALMIASVSMAQNVTGLWKGKMDLDMSALPKTQNADQQKQMMEMVKKMMGNMTMKLTLNANKTFSMVVTGLPTNPQTQQKVKDQTAKGTWSMTGNKLTLKVTEANGEKPKADNNKPQVLTVSKDGKSMTLVPNTPGASMGKSKIVFTR